VQPVERLDPLELASELVSEAVEPFDRTQGRLLERLELSDRASQIQYRT
jgi:hypothetical protein